jgi:DNA-binding response OmpR family regulator
VAGHRPADGRGEVVLIVEDDDAIRALAEHLLKQHGYDVRTARTAEEAIGLSETTGESIGLLLTDVVLPGESGPSLALRLRAQQPGMRCLFMSGYTDDALKHHGLADYQGAYIQKPFRPSALLQKVREQLDRTIAAET